MKFLSQKQDTTCVPVAIANLAMHLDMPCMNVEELSRLLCCHTGGAIGEDLVIEEIFGDRTEYLIFKSKDDADYVLDSFFKTGGIMTIMHPVWNLHACLCLPSGDKFLLVNSWLGPNEMEISKEEIRKFLPPHYKQYGFWRIKP